MEACQKGATVNAEGILLIHNASVVRSPLSLSLSPSLSLSFSHTPSLFSPARVKASEEKFVKLREVYSKLRNEHIQLLRTEGEGRKKLQVLCTCMCICHTHLSPFPLSPPPLSVKQSILVYGSLSSSLFSFLFLPSPLLRRSSVSLSCRKQTRR